MRISKDRLRQIINEELEVTLNEWVIVSHKSVKDSAVIQLVTSLINSLKLPRDKYRVESGKVSTKLANPVDCEKFDWRDPKTGAPDPRKKSCEIQAKKALDARKEHVEHLQNLINAAKEGKIKYIATSGADIGKPFEDEPDEVLSDPVTQAVIAALTGTYIVGPRTEQFKQEEPTTEPAEEEPAAAPPKRRKRRGKEQPAPQLGNI